MKIYEFLEAKQCNKSAERSTESKKEKKMSGAPCDTTAAATNLVLLPNNMKPKSGDGAHK